MAINTYATLLTAVENWLARSDTALTDRIPEFIALFEAKMNRELRCNQMETRAYTTADTTDNEPEFVTLPSDFQTMRRVRLSSVTGKPRLTFLAGQQADDYRYSTANATGQPIYFTIFGDEMELLPTPDSDYTIEMVYRANIPALTAVNTTNWLLTLAPDLYLYGALMEASAYTAQDERVPVWYQAYQYALDGVNRLGIDQAYNAGPLEVRMVGNVP
jgi:hypothetical protein